MKHLRSALRPNEGPHSWQNIALMHSRRSPGQEKRPFTARYRRHASKMSWFWQDMLPMYSKCPTKRRWRIHQANILPGRGAFRCTDPLNHAWRATLAMLDGSRWTNPVTLDGSRWTNPATLDGSTGRILSRLVVSVVQILPSRPGGSRWANPVGQSTLDEANGFHLRVRHCHFRKCPLGKST